MQICNVYLSIVNDCKILLPTTCGPETSSLTSYSYNILTLILQNSGTVTLLSLCSRSKDCAAWLE